MKFSIQKETLLSLLIEHNKVVPIRTTLPVLSNAFFSIKENTLLIKTTNLDQTIVSKTKIKDEKEGSTTVPMHKLLEIVTALPNEELSFSSNKNNLVEINNNQGSYKITGKNAEEFPENTNISKKNTLSVPGKELVEIINKTTYATSKDDLKPALTGVYFNIKEGQITAVATDGHKLVKYKKEIVNPNKKEQSIIIPSKFLNILKSTLEKNKDIIIDIDENHISTEQKNFIFISRIIKENFPDFNSVIPSDNKIKSEIKTKDFLSCVKRVSIFSNRNTKQIILNFNSNGVVVSAEDIETATSGKEHFNCIYQGEDLSTSYNAKYLCETIQHIEEEKIEMFLNSPLSAAIIKPKTKKEKEDLTVLLMPLRINI